MIAKIETGSKLEIRDVSLLLGVLIGLIPSISGLPTISILLIAIVYAYRNRDKFFFLFSIPIFQYLIIQFLINWWHSGSPFSIDIQNYYVLLIITIPIIQFFVSQYNFNVDRMLTGLALGLLGSVTILIFDYYSVWNGYTCRASGFQTNPLRAAIFFVPLAGLLVAINAAKTKFDLISSILIVSILLYSGAITGARMTFYSAIGIICMFIAYFIFKKQVKNAAKLLGSAALGIAMIFAFEFSGRCNFTARLAHNFQLILSLPSASIENPRDEEQIPLAPLCENGAEPTACMPEENAETSNEPTVIPANSSEGTRALLWENAIQSFLKHPLIGTGAESEELVINVDKIQPGLTGGAHNQYLSWAIWGGVVSLMSGLILFLTHFLCNQNRFASAIFLASFALSSLSMSSLAIGGAMAEFVLLLVVLSPILGARGQVWFWKIGK